MLRGKRLLTVSILSAVSTFAASQPELLSAVSLGPPPNEDVAAAETQGATHCRAIGTRRFVMPGAEITGVRAVRNRGGTVEITPPSGTAVPDVGFCEVEVSVTHGVEGTEGLPADDTHIYVWLPDEWNGRFQAIGGGGTRATHGAGSMVPALKEGYAVAVGDAGLSVEHPQTYIFLTNGTFNWQLFENWSYRSVHETAALAKQVIQAHYGKAPKYSYWNGCSNGGRQGLEMAQRYPNDFDGVLAGAPAIYGAERLNLTMSWPAFLQNDAFGRFIPTCKMKAMSQALVDACDGLDGVIDGLVSNPEDCDFESVLDSQVGKSLPCGEISAAEVAVAVKILEGPQDEDGRFVWYGHAPGVDLGSGVMRFHDGWAIQTFLMHDPSYDWRTATTEDLIEVFGPKYRGRLDILSGSDPVLEPFANSGGKLLVWHGLTDELFPAAQSVHYYNEVRQLSGSSTADFFRLFLAPGVNHCRGGNGPMPEDPMSALVTWVERGVAPDSLRVVKRDAEGNVIRERNLCPYPQVQVYDGSGDIDRAGSFRCGDAFPPSVSS